jgi:hypothetical protein
MVLPLGAGVSVSPVIIHQSLSPLQKDSRVIILYSHERLCSFDMLVGARMPVGKIRRQKSKFWGNSPGKGVPKTGFLTEVAESAP